MNQREYLLVCLSEELAEMQQEIAKVLRFSPDHCPPGSITSNLERCSGEFSDVICILDLLKDAGISIKVSDTRIQEKRERTLRFMDVSRNLGTLQKLYRFHDDSSN